MDDAAKGLDKINREAIFENCAPFTECISLINNTQADNAKYLMCDVNAKFNRI